MTDKLTLYLIGRDRGLDVDLEGRSSREEWDDLQAGEGRWAQELVAVKAHETRTTYVLRDAVVRADVDYTAPASPEVAEKTALEETRAEERRRAGLPPLED